ncbi:MAG: ATP-binding protein [Prevotellaceae bacterium]|nr:ATP-binding protein [Prevotellaceae bacterium]
MEQKSNVQYRAEKEYKNSREKFFLLLREIISNAIHAVLIRKTKEEDYIPKLNLNIAFDDSQCKIELSDNGEGFNEKNRKYFEELDRRNPEKEKLNFHPLGQGRLAIIFLLILLNTKLCIKMKMVNLTRELYRTQVHQKAFLVFLNLRKKNRVIVPIQN